MCTCAKICVIHFKLTFAQDNIVFVSVIAAMPGYKLIYFPTRGRAQAIRYILEDNNIEYDEELITSMEAWLKVKPKMTFGQVPCFHDGDLELAQSGAIVRYLARKHDLYGTSPTEAALMDMVYDGQEDLKKKFWPMLYTKENYEDAKAKYMESLSLELEKFEKLLQRNTSDSGYFVGNQISFADYAVFDLVYNHEVYAPGCLNDLPLLKAFIDRMKARENLAKYMSTDKFKEMKATTSGKL